MMRRQVVGVAIDATARRAQVWSSDHCTYCDDAAPMLRRAGKMARAIYGDDARIWCAAVTLAERQATINRLHAAAVDGLPGYRVELPRYVVSKGPNYAGRSARPADDDLFPWQIEEMGA